MPDVLKKGKKKKKKLLMNNGPQTEYTDLIYCVFTGVSSLALVPVVPLVLCLDLYVTWDLILLSQMMSVCDGGCLSHVWIDVAPMSTLWRRSFWMSVSLSSRSVRVVSMWRTKSHKSDSLHQVQAQRQNYGTKKQAINRRITSYWLIKINYTIYIYKTFIRTCYLDHKSSGYLKPP